MPSTFFHSVIPRCKCVLYNYFLVEKMHHVTSIVLVALATIFTGSFAHEINPGVWTWACGGAAYHGDHRPGHYERICREEVHVSPPPELRGALQVFNWAVLEPEEGVFDWYWLDKNLTAMADAKVQANPIIFIHKGQTINGAATTPEWLFKVSPGIPYTHAPQTKPVFVAPNYLDPKFQKIFSRLIYAFANHLNELPTRVKDNIWGVQAALGITGDSRPWKGSPVNKSQEISYSQWEQYSRTMLEVFVEAFVPTEIPIVANVDNPQAGSQSQLQNTWFIDMAEKKGMTGAGLKQGVPTHGYNLNGEKFLYHLEAVPLLLTPRADGTYTPARGELALEPDAGVPGEYGNWAESPWWSLQANAEWVLTYGISAWNLYAGFLSNATFRETLQFVNRHAGYMNASTAPAAFISFRDSLNTEDTERWPETKYGKVADIPWTNGTLPPNCNANKKRMKLIAEDFKEYGAKLESAKEASDPRSIVQKKGMHLNDVCWNCWPGNYFRYIQQIKPTETSVGWWRLGPKHQGYGRFARGLEHATGRKLITLQLDPNFKKMNATATVVYYNAGKGSWSIAYNGETKGTIAKTSTDSWITSAKIPLGSVSGDGKITLFSPDQKDCIFSLLEILQVK